MAFATLKRAGWLGAVLGIASLALAWGAEPPALSLPNDGDEYSRLVARAEAGDQSLDFRALRLAWLDSAARKRASAGEIQKSRDGLRAALENDDPASVAAAARKVLSVNYIDMDGHGFLRKACTKLGDKACADHHHFVEFGLLKSITTTGDGKTCDTGWQVVSIPEEYFIVNALDLKRTRQALVKGAHFCDRLDVTGAEGAPPSLFFNIDAFFGRELE